MELYLHFPNTPSWRGAQLKHRETLLTTVIIMMPLYVASEAVCAPLTYGQFILLTR